MDGWLLALIIIVVIILFILILWALIASPTASVQVSRGQNVSNNGQNSLALAHLNLAQQTSNFIQQAKYGYKGLKVTYDQMNKLAEYIGKSMGSSKLGDYLKEKNEIYKELVERIVVNGDNLKPDDHLFKHLDETNQKIADILAHNYVTTHNLKDQKSFDDARTKYRTLLHKYDVAVVSQMKYVADGDHAKAAAAAFQAQSIMVNGA